MPGECQFTDYQNPHLQFYQRITATIEKCTEFNFNDVTGDTAFF